MKHSLLIFLSILALQDAHAAKIQYTEQLFGQTCFTQPVSFPTSSFTYSIAVNQYKVGAGCDPSQVLISPLYMKNSCLEPRDNSYYGCPSSTTSGIVIYGDTISSSGSKTSVNNTGAICNQAFTGGSYESLASTGTTLDTGTVKCGPDTIGFIYFQNNCPASTINQTIMTLTVSYTTSTCGSSGSSYDYYSSTVTWPIGVGIAAAVFVLVFLTLFICGRRRRMQQQQAAMQQVQMMPPPPPPSSMGMPNGYPPPPPMASNPSSTTPYPAYPTIPPPMSTGPVVSNTAPATGYPAPQYNSDGTTGGGVNQPAVWYAGGKPPGS